MKITTILSVAGLIMIPIIGLAQTSEIQVTPSQPVITTAQQSTSGAYIKTPQDLARCGVYSYKFSNQCSDSGVGGGSMHKNIYAECFDGFGITLEDILCKSWEEWIRSADEACMNHCPNKDVPPSSDEPPTTPAIPETAVPAKAQTPVFEKLSIPEKPIITPTPTPTPTTPGASIPTTVATSPDIKCGVNTSKVYNECGAGAYKNISAQCYDGFAVNLGETTSCKSVDLWNQYAKETCASHCSKGVGSATVSAGGGYGTISTTAIQMPASQTTTVPTPTTLVTPAATLPPTKCGVISVSYSDEDECGFGLYKNVSVQCYDGYKTKLGAGESSCRSDDAWDQYVKNACVNRCSNGRMPGTVFTGGEPSGISTEGPITTVTTKSAEIPRATPVCYIGDYLFQKYNQLIIELQKSESDKTRTELITKEIIALKQQISTQQKECVHNSPQSTAKIVPWSAPTITPQSMSTGASMVTENIPVAVSIDRCNEVTQWETKIVYYKKLGNLSDDELRKNGFSREEIEKILQELSLGIEKVRAQCSSQEKTPVTPKATAITGSASIAETVRPVVIESGREIDTYYKARLEKAVSVKGEEKQIEELKTLRDEIDGLISNLIKSRKELEVSELNTLVKEVRVSRGEIKADNISVKTTEKKMILSVGDRPVSVEPAENQVIIRDKGLEVNTNEVTIKENVLSVGGVDVKMSASEVAEKFGFTPTTIELKEENAKAVYNMKIDERRKLFWFIPLNVRRTVSADAENGNMLSEQHPWYSFLTTK